jgi:GNAT superfamily N-acetyltransferase
VRGEALGSRLAPVHAELPDGFDDLRAAARAEGHRFLDRLAADWTSSTIRFDERGERLLASYVDGKLAAIGGLTSEPLMSNALRMRRFYVRPSHRRTGVGHRLASALLEHAAGTAELVTVNAQIASFAFWESLGFIRLTREGLTHARSPGGQHERGG